MSGVHLYTLLDFARKYDDDVIVNGDMEDWTDMEPDNWDVTENGSGTVTRSEVNNGGSYSADLYNPSGGGNTVSIQQDVSVAVGTNVKFSVDIRCDTSARDISIKSYDPTGSVGTVSDTFDIPLANTWYTATYNFVWGSRDNAFNIGTRGNGHYYIDNAKIEPWHT